MKPLAIIWIVAGFALNTWSAPAPTAASRCDKQTATAVEAFAREEFALPTETIKILSQRVLVRERTDLGAINIKRVEVRGQFPDGTNISNFLVIEEIEDGNCRVNHITLMTDQYR